MHTRVERETGGSGERGSKRRRSRGLRIRALQILFVREPATRNRLRGVGALLRVTFAVRRTFSGGLAGGMGEGRRDGGCDESSALSLQGVDERSDRLASGHESLR